MQILLTDKKSKGYVTCGACIERTTDFDCKFKNLISCKVLAYSVLCFLSKQLIQIDRLLDLYAT